MISLIVTHYNEPFEVMKPLLDSIKMQLGFNFENLEVIIVEDNDDPISEIVGYPFEIRIISQGHKGVSAARNFGLAESKGEYVMFCDCDDQFIELYALHLYDTHNQFNVVKSPFVEDQVVDGELKLIRHDRDTTFIHGKMFNKSFLMENNLKFNEELTIHEDSFFIVLCDIVAGESKYEMSPAVYLWKYNENSIVRKDREMFVFKTYDHLMKCRKAICKELYERGFITEFYQAVCKTVMDSYYDFQKDCVFNPEYKGIVNKAYKAFRGFFNEYEDFYRDIALPDKAQMMFMSRSMSYSKGFLFEHETLKDFLNRGDKPFI